MAGSICFDMLSLMPGKIRIIAGQWRGRRLPVPDSPGLRPTGDRARETLFNWIGPRCIGARCLDLFAGSGALGLEAASRGAAQVTLIEREAWLCQQLRSSIQDLPGSDIVSVVHADALRWIETCADRFDLVFIDPPFDSRLQASVLVRLIDRGLLADQALVYVEQALLPGQASEPALAAGFELVREKAVGRVLMRLLRAGQAGAL